MYRFIPITSAAALLAGCAFSPATGPDGLPLNESPSYFNGYNDGCLTSNEEDKSFSTKIARDSYAFDNDKAYRAGWRQGYLQCGERIPDAKDGGRILGERNEY